jgi:riboflavin biosynthesis pyrimidine reductase
MVIDLAGNTSLNSDSITSDLDRALLRHIRFVSDLIVTTGATFRAEKLKPSRLAPMLVLSRESSPNLDNPLADGVLPVFVRSGVNPVQVTKNFMSEHGFTSAVIECGPAVTETFAFQGAIDQFCLTVIHGAAAVASKEHVIRLLENLGFVTGEPVMHFQDSTHSYWTAFKKDSN